LNPEASRPASEQPTPLGFPDFEPFGHMPQQARGLKGSKSGACELKGSKVGIDLGIKTFAMLSTGEAVQAPDYSHSSSGLSSHRARRPKRFEPFSSRPLLEGAASRFKARDGEEPAACTGNQSLRMADISDAV